MKLATVRRSPHELRAVRIESDHAVVLDASDVGTLLAHPDYRRLAAADGVHIELNQLDLAPVVPSPDKIICVGLNYRGHVAEMGRELPAFPTIFAKYRGALIGAADDIVLPPESNQADWEAELTIVIGQRCRRVSVADALGYVAGYTIMNDVSMRDWQNRTMQFLQGKTFESSTPVGPWMVTADELPANPGPHQSIGCSINGTAMQQSTTDDLVFGVAELVAYISTILTLLPGDLIATGTPAGVGAGRKPAQFLQPGDQVVTTISGIGQMSNRCIAEASS